MTASQPRLIVAIGIAGFALAALIAPTLSHPAYSSLSHTLSELAGQLMPNAWIMRIGFVSFGSAVVIASLMLIRAAPGVFGALVLFGAAMIGAAIWSHLPIPAISGGSQAEDDFHSIAASAMGGAFALACGARAWTRRAKGPDWMSLSGLAISVAIPAIMFQVPAITGGAQRLMFLFSFAWILQTFSQGRLIHAGIKASPS
jgi:hypothetical protein